MDPRTVSAGAGGGGVAVPGTAWSRLTEGAGGARRRRVAVAGVSIMGAAAVSTAVFQTVTGTSTSLAMAPGLGGLFAVSVPTPQGPAVVPTGVAASVISDLGPSSPALPAPPADPQVGLRAQQGPLPGPGELGGGAGPAAPVAVAAVPAPRGGPSREAPSRRQPVAAGPGGGGSATGGGGGSHGHAWPGGPGVRGSTTRPAPPSSTTTTPPATTRPTPPVPRPHPAAPSDVVADADAARAAPAVHDPDAARDRPVGPLGARPVGAGARGVRAVVGCGSPVLLSAAASGATRDTRQKVTDGPISRRWAVGVGDACKDAPSHGVASIRRPRRGTDAAAARVGVDQMSEPDREPRDGDPFARPQGEQAGSTGADAGSERDQGPAPRPPTPAAGRARPGRRGTTPGPTPGPVTTSRATASRATASRATGSRVTSRPGTASRATASRATASRATASRATASRATARPAGPSPSPGIRSRATGSRPTGSPRTRSPRRTPAPAPGRPTVSRSSRWCSRCSGCSSTSPPSAA